MHVAMSRLKGNRKASDACKLTFLISLHSSPMQVSSVFFNTLKNKVDHTCATCSFFLSFTRVFVYLFTYLLNISLMHRC